EARQGGKSSWQDRPDSRSERPRSEGRRSEGGQSERRASRSQGLQQLPGFRLDFLLDEYERDLRRREIAAHTIRNYRKVLDLALRCWTEHFGRPPTLDDFSLRAGETFVDHLLDRGKLQAWGHGGSTVTSATPRKETDASHPTTAGRNEPARNELKGNEQLNYGALAVESVRCYVRTLKAFSNWLAAPKQRYTDGSRLALLA